MRKKIITVLMACMAATAIFGCGDGKEQGDNAQGTESALQEGTEAGAGASSPLAELTYDAEDYVTLGEYMGVEVTLKEADYQITQEEVNSYADQMIAYTKPFVADESKTVIGEGDIVDVDYVGKKDGEAFAGGSAENQYIDVSNNSNASTGTGYIDGFTDGLIGVKVGETVDCESTFPENYQSEDLAGQTVTFSFTVNGICKKVDRESIDDAFVKEYLQSESVDDFYSNVKNALTEQKESNRQSDIRAKVLDSLLESCKVDSLPEGLLDARLDAYVEGFKQQYCSDGTDLNSFLTKNYNMTEEEFETQNRTYLESNLKQELILEAIVKNEKIAFDQEGFDRYIDNIVANGGFESEDQLYETYGAGIEYGKKYLKNVYLDNLACDKLVEKAKVTYVDGEDGGSKEK